MATETKIQEFVHALEEGGWVGKIRFVLLMAAIAALACLFLLIHFKGLNHGMAMDQAQIARQIASGHGFTTKFIRPATITQFVNNKGAFPPGHVPDTYHAPLNPIVNAVVLRLARGSWEMTPADILYICDQFIAGAAMFFFLLSVAVNFVTAKRLFDRRLALLGVGLILVCDHFWRFSLTGLPQMLMLFLFSLCTYFLVRAIEARQLPEDDSYEGDDRPRRGPLVWLVLAAVCFGLLGLTHAITIWTFGGVLFFAAFAFWPASGRWWMRVVKSPALIMLAVFLMIYSPWLARNYRVCGSPFGISIYAGLYQIRGTESDIMRSRQLDLIGLSPVTFRIKVHGQTMLQLGQLYELLGRTVAAPVFFLSLLHAFKRRHAASFRWGLLLMWLSGLMGMSVFGMVSEGGFYANDLHVLFIPMFIFYGLAFLLVLWARLLNERPELNMKLVRLAFLALIYLISAFPLVGLLILGKQGRVHWPPYIPPYIAILKTWFTENEIIASDMPWAVAWYANRESLWVPKTVEEFVPLNDYQQLGSPLVGLYLTPVSGNERFMADIVKGDWKEWAPFILRSVNTQNFPLRAVTALPIENQCVLYADRDRWSERED